MRSVRYVQLLLVAAAVGVIVSVIGFVALQPSADDGEPHEAAGDSASPSRRRGSVAARPDAVPEDGEAAAGAAPATSAARTEREGRKPATGVARHGRGDQYSDGRHTSSYEFELAQQRDHGGREVDDFRLSGVTDDGRYDLFSPYVRSNASGDFWRAEDGVAIDREDGARLRSVWAEHHERAGVQVAGGDVRIGHGDRLLACARADFKRDTDQYILAGPVGLMQRAGDEVLAARCGRLRYWRQEGRLLLSQVVTLVRPDLAVHGRRLEADLEADTPKFARLRDHGHGGVRFEHFANPDASREDEPGCEPKAWYKLGWTKGLDVAFEAGVPRSVRSLPGAVVRVDGFDFARLLWSLAARDVRVTLDADGAVTSATATQVRWHSAERGADGGPRESYWAATAEASFDAAGSLSLVEFPRGLEARRGDELRVKGDRARLRDDVVTVTANPWLENEATTLTADLFEIGTTRGDLIARGNVAVIAEPTGDDGGALVGTAGGPLRVRAAEMVAAGDSDRVIYRGDADDDVVLWRGADMLSAREVTADKSFTGLQARRRVRLTLWSGEDRLEAFAAELSYDGEMVVLGGRPVTLTAPDLRVEAHHARIWLGAGRSVTRIYATGSPGSPVQARRGGRQSWSDELDHRPQQGQTVLTGGDDLARVIDAAGRESLGNTLVIWSEVERVHVGSESGGGIAVTRVDARRAPANR